VLNSRISDVEGGYMRIKSKVKKLESEGTSNVLLNSEQEGRSG
jgi:hypothetical protein